MSNKSIKGINTKRSIDLVLVFFAIIITALPMVIISVLIKITSSGPILYWSDRVGQYNEIFSMPKFRTMIEDAPQVATHLLDNPDLNLTKIGGFLRNYSLDELPQLYCILFGLMSFVGPRPALYNQKDLIDLRTKVGIDKLLPGLTGWAQVNGRNAISWEEKFKLDVWYVDNQSFKLDCKILWMTLSQVWSKKGVDANSQKTMPEFEGNKK